MIPLFYYRKLTIGSPLSQNEAVEKLLETVAAPRGPSFGFESRQQTFEGSVASDEFRISRIIRYRNDFLPVIYGHFYPQKTGLRIQITMTLSPVSLVFALGFGVAISAFLLMILYWFVTTGSVDNSLKKPAVILTLVYVVFTLAFGFEAIIATRLLKRIFRAE